MTPFARALCSTVRFYQHARAGRPSPCRFQPSCSSYAALALERYGARSGSWLAIRRIARCNPWGGEGWDPVPSDAGSPGRCSHRPLTDRSAA